MIWPLTLYVLTAAMRDRLVWSMAGIVVVVLSLSVFFGSSAVMEQDQFVKTFTAYGLRLFGTVSIVLFIVNYVRRSFEARDVEYLLSRPIGRIKFVLVHSLAFSLIAFLFAFIVGGVVFVMNQGNIDVGFFLWWASIFVEFVIMANVAMFFAFVMTSTTACTIIVFAFYLLSRLMGEILGILAKNTSDGIFAFLSQIMNVISIIIPRLDMMGQTKWLLYGVTPEISYGFMVAQTLVFLSLVVCATCIDMKRRQF